MRKKASAKIKRPAAIASSEALRALLKKGLPGSPCAADSFDEYIAQRIDWALHTLRKTEAENPINEDQRRRRKRLRFLASSALLYAHMIRTFIANNDPVNAAAQGVELGTVLQELHVTPELWKSAALTRQSVARALTTQAIVSNPRMSAKELRRCLLSMGDTTENNEKKLIEFRSGDGKVVEAIGFNSFPPMVSQIKETLCQGN